MPGPIGVAAEPQRKLERVGSEKFSSFAEAADRREKIAKKHAKVKIFSRNDGTYDLVSYKEIPKDPIEKKGKK